MFILTKIIENKFESYLINYSTFGLTLTCSIIYKNLITNYMENWNLFGILEMNIYFL